MLGRCRRQRTICWIQLIPSKHVPAHFEYIRKELENADYKVIGVDLPGNCVPLEGGESKAIDDDIAAIREAILSQLEDRNDVIVVTHSYSSIPGTAAVAGLSTQARDAEGKQTSVKRVVIMAGFLLPPGTTMLSVMGGKLAPQYLHEGNITLPFSGPGARHVLYNDIDPAEADKAVWRLKPQSYAINTSATPDQVAALQGIPLSYLATNNDNAVPFAVQEQTIAGYKAAGIDVTAEVAGSGHSPFLILPKETALFIRKAAGEALETGFEEFKG